MPRRPRPTDPFMGRIPRRPTPRDASEPRSLRLPSTEESARGVAIAWKVANFGMYRAVIERLRPDERFRVETQFGDYEMSAEEFEKTFPSIVRSASYQTGSPRQHGKCVYVVGPPPGDAKRFKV